MKLAPAALAALFAGCLMSSNAATPTPPQTAPATPTPRPAPAGKTQWTFRTDPLPERGRPTVDGRAKGTPQTVRLTVTDLSDPDKVYESRTVPNAQSIHYPFPAVDRDTYARLAITAPEKGDELLFAWNALLRPRNTPLIDYTGRQEMLPPDDFDAYWARAKKELDAVALNPRVTRVTDKDTSTGLLHRVELPTVRNTKIVCWYYVPRAAFDAAGKAVRQFPAIIIMPGYGAEEPPLDRTDQGFITLSINPRSHGPSAEFWKAPGDALLYNLDDPENYFYKLAFLDCLRGAQFLFSRPEVDGKRVAAEGGSQGGLFAIALAALEPRIACVCSNVTAFSDYPDGMVLAEIGHHTQFREQLAKAKPDEAKKIRLSLEYTDGANMVTRVHCPVQINMGGQDPVSPYVCGIVVYNRVPKGVEREFHIVPDAKHEVTEAMREFNRAWYAKWLQAK